MAIRATPYLTFNGNCRKAMGFYKECFGGELSLQTIAETPMAARCPSGMQQHIMHSALIKGDFLLMATDMVGPAGFMQGSDMAVSLDFDDEQEIKTCFEKLSAGGNIFEPLRDAAWARCLVQRRINSGKSGCSIALKNNAIKKRMYQK